MKIRFWWNAFIEIDINDCKVVCDPWINEIKPGYGWQPNSLYDVKKVYDCVNSANFIYISHIHYDHYDPSLLCNSNLNESIPILIPKLKNNHLFKNISSNFQNPIIELIPFSKKKVSKDLELCLIPQMSNSTSNIEGIGYDMDSSLIFHDLNDGSTFFNTVDNPLSPKNFSAIKNMNLYPKIDLLTLPCGSASEYPQSYLGINREYERKRLKQISYETIKKQINALDCPSFTNAGGEYSICNRLLKLEKYKVFQEPKDLQKIAKETGKNYLHLKDKVEVFINNGEISIKELEKNFRFSKNKNLIDQQVINEPVLNLKLSAAEELNINQEKLFNELKLAKSSLYKSIENLNLNFDNKLELKIYIYQDIPRINSSTDFLEITEKPLKTFELLSSFGEKKERTIKLHCSIQLLFDCINKKTSWNTALTSSSILIERIPNIYNPADQEIINFAVK